MIGILRLSSALSTITIAPNAQLRVMNPHVQSAMREGKPANLVVQPAVELATARPVGGVSSFGLNGTIAHAVISSCLAGDSDTKDIVGFQGKLVHGISSRLFLSYRQNNFPWRDPIHPLAQQLLPTSSDGAVFQSSAAGALYSLVSDHIVQGRILFPGMGYLEMARAAASALETAPTLLNVFFLQPLVIETAGMSVECAVIHGNFEVREVKAHGNANVYCSGNVSSHRDLCNIDNATLRSGQCLHSADLLALYDTFTASGLQYGPGYRTLAQAWGGNDAGAARLRMRITAHEAMTVHPADLDDSLCVGAVISARTQGGGETRLPFAVDNTRLHGALGELWAVCYSRRVELVASYDPSSSL